jgi:hypothetical protein
MVLKDEVQEKNIINLFSICDGKSATDGATYYKC